MSLPYESDLQDRTVEFILYVRYAHDGSWLEGETAITDNNLNLTETSIYVFTVRYDNGSAQ